MWDVLGASGAVSSGKGCQTPWLKPSRAWPPPGFLASPKMGVGMGALAHLPVEGGGENTCSKHPPARLTWALSLEEKATEPVGREGRRRLSSVLPPKEWFYYIYFFPSLCQVETKAGFFFLMRTNESKNMMVFVKMGSFRVMFARNPSAKPLPPQETIAILV